MKDLSKNKIAYISGAKVVRGFFPKDNVERIELISIDEIEASAIGDFDMRNADELFLFYVANIRKNAFDERYYLKKKKKINLIFDYIGEIWCEDLNGFASIEPFACWSTILLVNISDQKEMEWLRDIDLLRRIKYIINATNGMLYKITEGEATVVSADKVVSEMRYIDNKLKKPKASEYFDRNVVFCNMCGEVCNVEADRRSDIFFLHHEMVGNIHRLYVPSGMNSITFYKCKQIHNAVLEYIKSVRHITLIKSDFCTSKSDFLKRFKSASSAKVYEYLSDYEKNIVFRF